MERIEELRTLVKESSSFNEIFRKLGKSNSGAALKKLKEELDAYGIDYKFVPEKLSGIKHQIPLEKILKEGVNYSSRDLKIRLIKSGLKKNECELCGIGNKWNNKSLTLHLDHINGIHTDNRLENLRVLCPNCHSQTETFGGRNLKRKSYRCCDCGKEIKAGSTRCCSCASRYRNISRDSYKKPSKEELLNSLKDRAINGTAKLYNVSYNAVVKWCKSYSIPHRMKELGEYLK